MPNPASLKIEHSAHPGSSFRDTDLCSSRFDDVNLNEASFENVDFSGSVFRNVRLSGVSIEDADLEQARINGILITDLLRVYADSRPK